ncbi:hypothetical protein [Bdellovibrio bacteriovorus]|uniref:hypothetical protein n=1 Tax=Bdellovibrio bacteriovorus TaxID=959 RepID=UPI0035A6EC76
MSKISGAGKQTSPTNSNLAKAQSCFDLKHLCERIDNKGGAYDAKNFMCTRFYFSSQLPNIAKYRWRHSHEQRAQRPR